jgi:hypothetical protein
MDYFFLSYARDENHEYVKSFYEDLSDMIRTIAGIADKKPVGFIDSNMEFGGEWPEDLMRTLQRYRTMVCLFSPTYLNSESCGKEYHIFHLRRELYVKQKNENGN